VKVLKKNKAVMSAFPQLSDGDIDNIIVIPEPKAEALRHQLVVLKRFLELVVLTVVFQIIY
jgi:hypothetical protein